MGSGRHHPPLGQDHQNGTFTLRYRFCELSARDLPLPRSRRRGFRLPVLARREPHALREGPSMIKPLLVALRTRCCWPLRPRPPNRWTITAQAKAARAEFLLTATPPGPAAAICLVDTGVNSQPGHDGRHRRVSISRRPRLRSEPDAATEPRWPCSSARRAQRVRHGRALAVRANRQCPGEHHRPGRVHSARDYAFGMQRCDDGRSKLRRPRSSCSPLAIQTPTDR